MKLRLLSDKQQIRAFIEEDTPCPADIIIECYLNCKERNESPPEKIISFVDTFLAGIVTAHRDGFKPDYDYMLGFTYKNGRPPKSSRTRLGEAVIIGEAVVEHMGQGNTYEKSITIVAEQLAISEESAKKAYTKYKKLVAPDVFDLKGPFDNE